MPRTRINTYSFHVLATDQADRNARVSVNGAVEGPLAWNETTRQHEGLFEFLPREERYVSFLSDDREIDRFEFEMQRDEVEFAPTNTEVCELADRLAAMFPSLVESRTVYTFPDTGRNIKLLVLTDREIPMPQKQVIMLTARVHHWEAGAATTILRFVRYLLFGEGRDKRCLEKYIFLLIPFAQPNIADPRWEHNNRLWLVDNLTEPDSRAIVDATLDRYAPELWIDIHNNGGFFAAHPVGEHDFDYPWTQDIAEKLVRASEARGFGHLDEWSGGFDHLRRMNVLHEDDERIDPFVNKVFNSKLYAHYYDRLRFGITGRDFPATASEFGYGHCHTLSFFDESRLIYQKAPFMDEPWIGTVDAPDFGLHKLIRLCEIASDHYEGNYHPGLPANAIKRCEEYPLDRAVVLFAWDDNGDYESLRWSRYNLWRNRRSFSIIQRVEQTGDKHVVHVRIVYRRRIEANWAFRVPVPAGCEIGTVQYEVVDRNVLLPLYGDAGRPLKKAPAPRALPTRPGGGRYIFIPQNPADIESELTVSFIDKQSLSGRVGHD